MPQLVKGITDQVTQVACGGGHTVAVTGRQLGVNQWTVDSHKAVAFSMSHEQVLVPL